MEGEGEAEPRTKVNDQVFIPALKSDLSWLDRGDSFAQAFFLSMGPRLAGRAEGAMVSAYNALSYGHGSKAKLYPQ